MSTAYVFGRISSSRFPQIEQWERASEYHLRQQRWKTAITPLFGTYDNHDTSGQDQKTPYVDVHYDQNPRVDTLGNPPITPKLSEES